MAIAMALALLPAASAAPREPPQAASDPAWKPVGDGAAAGPAVPEPLSYGPVLHPDRRQAADPAPERAARAGTEPGTPPLVRAAPQPARPVQPAQPARPAQPVQPGQARDGRAQALPARRRHEAWQPAGPLAPRPLRPDAAAVSGQGALAPPQPQPQPQPQPVVPGAPSLQSCAGGSCRDAGGRVYNLGPGGAGVDADGRPCTLVGTAVQCL